MSKLPLKIRNRLNKEALEWDVAIQEEDTARVQELMEEAELFESWRPARQPVSLRLDPFDIAMLKRMARRKGIPYTQLMSMWIHERIEQEKTAEDS